MKQLFLFLALLTATSIAYGVDSTFNGAWFDPSNDGHGIFIDSNDEVTVISWFTYSFGGDQQAWYISEANQIDSNEFIIYKPTGAFPALNQQLGEQAGTIEVAPFTDDILIFSWSFNDFNVFCSQPGFSPPFNFCTGSQVFVRLLPNP